MPTAEELKALVGRIPDPDDKGTYANLDQSKVQEIEGIVARLLQGGRDAALGLIDMLVEPGKGDDVKARFALHLLSVRVTQQGNHQVRDAFSQAVASQVGGTHPKAVQEYLIEQVQLAGTGAAAEPLGKALLDPELCDAAARALVAIRHGAAEQMLRALPKVQGPSRRSLLAKLAALKSPEAAGAFRQALDDADPETRVAAAWGIVRIADAAAAEPLLKCADARSGWERNSETDACLALAEALSAAGKKQQAAAIYAHLAKTRADPSERHVRAAAERGLAAA